MKFTKAFHKVWSGSRLGITQQGTPASVSLAPNSLVHFLLMICLTWGHHFFLSQLYWHHPGRATSSGIEFFFSEAPCFLPESLFLMSCSGVYNAWKARKQISQMILETEQNIGTKRTVKYFWFTSGKVIECCHKQNGPVSLSIILKLQDVIILECSMVGAVLL